MYADCDDVKKLIGEKYANLPASELRGNKAFIDDLMEADIKMTIRLQIVFGKLSIRSVRSAFKDSVGNRLKKFGGLDNDELLQRLTNWHNKISLFDSLRLAVLIIFTFVASLASSKMSIKFQEVP